MQPVAGYRALARTPENRLLAALPAKDFARLRDSLEPVSLHSQQTLYERNRPVKSVYFPIDALVSIVTKVSGEPMTEVGVVGREGMIGLPAFFTVDRWQFRAFVQIEGRALRMGVRDFRAEMTRRGPLAEILLRYTHAFLTHVAQTGACCQMHSAQQRCVRWLLMSHERVARDEFMLTQDFLCQVLSVRRATVSEIASALQRAGLIRYSRGRMVILDRRRLEAMCCTCYEIIRSEYDKVSNTKLTRTRRQRR